MTASSDRKLNVCMLLPLTYKPGMRVYPSIDILSHIAHFGHHVTWVISSEVHAQPEHFYRNSTKVYVILYRHYLPGNSIPAKIFNQVLHSWQKTRFARKVFSEGKYDLIFVRADVFYGLTALYIKRKYKIPFVFELSGALEMDWEAYKTVRKKPLCLYYVAAKFDEFLTSRLLHRADLVLPISKWLEQDLVKHKGIAEEKITPLPEGVDIAAFSNADGQQIVEKYHLGNSKVIIYEGTLARLRNLSILLQAFHRVRTEKEDVKLLVVGEGDDQESLQKLADELGLRDDVIFTGQVPQSEVPDFIAAADVGISPIPPLSFYKLSSPIKMVEYMAVAKPVVANEEIPDQKEILGESGGGILVTYAPEAFASAILRLLDNPQEAAEMGRKGKEWVVANRSYKLLARQVEKSYLELVGIRLDGG